MMVNEYDAERWLISLQTDHSHLAGQLAAHWGNDTFRRLTPYASMVVAAQEHDGGWWEWELKPDLAADGKPQDYISSIRNLGDGVWLSMYRNGIDRLASVDPYSALIVQMHAEGLLTQGAGLLPYMPSFADVPGAPEFLAEGKQRRADLIERLSSDPALAPFVTESALAVNFQYMETFDQFGQLLCNRSEMDHNLRKNGPSEQLSGLSIPVRDGVPDTTLTIIPVDADTAVVDPYPFDLDPLVLLFPARLMYKKPYTQDEFVAEFLRAEQIVVVRRLQSSASSTS